MSYLVASAPQKENPKYLPEWAFVGLQKCYGRCGEDKSPPHPLGDMTRVQMPVSRGADLHHLLKSKKKNIS
jgi:hypothetical protein